MNTPAMQYHVVTASSVDDLACVVQARLESGWRLQGGVSVSPEQRANKGQMLFAQAMTLDALPPSA